MVKNLYLLRHADAEIDSSTGQDTDRELSQEGHKKADLLVIQLLEKHISFDRILCSTAQRVRQTYEHIASVATGLSPQYLDELYNPSLEAMLEVLKNQQDSYNSVLIISHNPTIGDVASYLSSNQIHFSPGDLKCLQLDIKSWQNITESCAKLVWSIPH